MKIERETEFDVGQEVWIVLHNFLPDRGKIELIRFTAQESLQQLLYGVRCDGRLCFREESAIWKTEAEVRVESKKRVEEAKICAL